MDEAIPTPPAITQKSTAAEVADAKISANKASFRLEYYAAVMTTIAAALGLLCALLWRDLIVAAMKTYGGVWVDDSPSIRDFVIVLVVVVIVTAISAALVVWASRWTAAAKV